MTRASWAALGLVVTLAGGCSDDGPGRAEQLRDLASDAGLGDDVAGFFELAAREADATYSLTLRSTGVTEDGSLQYTVVQRPPDRRVEVLLPEGTANMFLRTDGRTRQCSRPPGADWTCQELDGDAVDPSGALSGEQLAEGLDEMRSQAADYDFRVEDRTVAGIGARCLVTTLKPGHEADGRRAAGTLCLSPEGAQVYIETATGIGEATAYTTDVADDAFAVP